MQGVFMYIYIYVYGQCVCIYIYIHKYPCIYIYIYIHIYLSPQDAPLRSSSHTSRAHPQHSKLTLPRKIRKTKVHIHSRYIYIYIYTHMYLLHINYIHTLYKESLQHIADVCFNLELSAQFITSASTRSLSVARMLIGQLPRPNTCRQGFGRPAKFITSASKESASK